MTLRAVFLDVGNTLLREEPSRFELYARVAVARGLEVDAPRMGELMRQAHAELPRVLDGAFRYSDPWFEAFIERIYVGELGLQVTDLRALQDELFDLFENPATFRLYPGALELCDGLRRDGLVVGLVSNWSARLPRVLDAVGLTGHVDFAVCSALERAEKPEARLFQIAMERAQVLPHEALHAGDHPWRDAEGARGAGLGTILVDHSGRLGEAGDTPLVRDLPELARWIARKRGRTERS